MRSNTVPAERGRALPCRAVTRRPLALASASVLFLFGACTRGTTSTSASGVIDPTLAARGKTIFGYETFGDETFWTDTLHMQQVIQSSVDPTTALSVGLKVDTDSLPAAVVQGIKNGTVDLKSPATTVALLKLNAVVGVRGTVATVNGRDELTRVGITCAFCHSTVDNSFAPGIGKRLDGFPNHDLNPGAIIALSPALSAEQKAVYNSWGPGRYDARYNHDGKNGPSVIPPAYGLLNVPEHHVHGRRSRDLILESLRRRDADARSRPLHRFAPGPEDVQNPPDSVSELLPALQEYQLSLSRSRRLASRFVRRGGRRARRGRVHGAPANARRVRPWGITIARAVACVAAGDRLRARGASRGRIADPSAPETREREFRPRWSCAEARPSPP